MSEVNLRGGCLCGGVKYEIRGEPVRFYHCHCSRCRKATGTGHASNIMVRMNDGGWTQGEELVTEYKVPEAQRFSTCFCSRCGGQLPRIRKQMGMAVVPAGSLDTDPGLMPEARIFWDSRTPWSCQGDGIPTYAEYPQRS